MSTTSSTVSTRTKTPRLSSWTSSRSWVSSRNASRRVLRETPSAPPMLSSESRVAGREEALGDAGRAGCPRPARPCWCGPAGRGRPPVRRSARLCHCPEFNRRHENETTWVLTDRSTILYLARHARPHSDRSTAPHVTLIRSTSVPLCEVPMSTTPPPQALTDEHDPAPPTNAPTTTARSPGCARSARAAAAPSPARSAATPWTPTTTSRCR